jgi:hypothetical protein
VSPKSDLELRRAVDFAGDQDGPVQQKRRMALFDDRKAQPLERRATGRGQLGRLESRKADPASGPELRIRDGGFGPISASGTPLSGDTRATEGTSV